MTREEFLAAYTAKGSGLKPLSDRELADFCAVDGELKWHEWAQRMTDSRERTRFAALNTHTAG